MQNHETIKTIGIIGAGNLGSRHLQALAHLDDLFFIEVVEPNDSSWEMAIARYKEVRSSDEHVRRCMAIDDLTNNLFAVIVATPSKPRMNVVSQLLSLKTVRHLILEKVLFQSLDEYRLAADLFNKHDTSVWINCPRRCFDFYQKLKEKIKFSDSLTIIVNGGEWGLGSSAVHMLDLYGYLSGSKEYNVESFERFELIDSKREGYSEIVGTICISSEKGKLVLSSEKGSQKPVAIYIIADNMNCLIYEYQRQAFISDKEAGWKISSDTFDIKYQSSLTNEVIMELVANDSCKLTTFDESAEYHVILIDAFLNEMNGIYEKQEVTICPIT